MPWVRRGHINPPWKGGASLEQTRSAPEGAITLILSLLCTTAPFLSRGRRVASAPLMHVPARCRCRLHRGSRCHPLRYM